MAKKGHVVIDFERCKACYLCIRACPKSVLAESEKLNSAGVYPVWAKFPDACIACGNCFTVCPDIAIEVYEREEKA